MATENFTITEKIAREEKALERLRAQQKKINAKIAQRERNLVNLRMYQSNQRMNTLEGMAAGMGLSMDDILTALQSGDFAALQDKANTNAEGTGSEEAGDSE